MISVREADSEKDNQWTHLGKRLESRVSAFKKWRKDKIRFELSHRFESGLSVGDSDRISREH